MLDLLCGQIYSRLSRSFKARGSVKRGSTKGIRLISSRVTKLSQRYNKNTCLTSVKHFFISSLCLAAILCSGEAHENNFIFMSWESICLPLCWEPVISSELNLINFWTLLTRARPIVFELLRKYFWRRAVFEPTEIEFCYQSTALPPSPHGWIFLKFDVSKRGFQETLVFFRYSPGVLQIFSKD